MLFPSIHAGEKLTFFAGMSREEQHGRFGTLNPSAAILFAGTLKDIFDISTNEFEGYARVFISGNEYVCNALLTRLVPT